MHGIPGNRESYNSSHAYQFQKIFRQQRNNGTDAGPQHFADTDLFYPLWNSERRQAQQSKTSKKKGDKKKRFTISKPFSSIDKIELGNEFIPDKFESNNSWKAK